MAKWADYLISKVCYNEKHTSIIEVKQHEDKGEKVGSSTAVSKSDVVGNIRNNKSYCTITKIQNGNWDQGDNVIAYQMDGEWFIRTDGNKTKEDNLGELPEFDCE